ncbi:MAG: hypothetical protein HUN05_00205 [Desulfobacter sp.]|nr:MAG: hypothetical protein HUN05_00205 [Desulfobacter sp.]
MVILLFSPAAMADIATGEAFYKDLSALARNGENPMIEKLNTAPRTLNWDRANPVQFKGHLRFLTSTKEGSPDETRLFFVRSTQGQIIILTIPDRADLAYQELETLGMFRILCHGFGSRICLSASGSKSQVREWAFNQPRRRS